MINDTVMNIADYKNFSSWTTLNDTIMGGQSISSISTSRNGLYIEGNIVEENGGFISCCSPLISPSLDLSNFIGLELKIKAHGETLKFAVSSDDSFTRFTEYFSGGLKWISEFKTNSVGTTNIQIPFISLEPNIRAKEIALPLKFNPSSINQFQLLYSKFGKSGTLNLDFQPGPVQILIESISAY